ncbi:MAG: metal ABC transporter solute-binding protein, Zn/Mn family [Thermogutta sp.]
MLGKAPRRQAASSDCNTLGWNSARTLSGCFLVLSGFALGWVVGCVRGTIAEPEDSRLWVAVTIPPQKWIMDKIGGDRVGCQVLISAQNDPHTFMGTDSDGARLARCQVFFTIGLPIENSPWCQAILQSRKILVVPLAEENGHGHSEAEDHHEHSHQTGLTNESQGEGEESHAHDYVLHTWLSPQRLIRYAEKVAETLCRIDPPGTTQYRENLAHVQKELVELDRELANQLKPLRGETFFVFHPAWECFAEDYGLFQQAVEVEGKDPSDREMTDLQRKARQTRLKVILVQPQFSSRAAQAIADVAGLRVLSVNPLAEDIPSELRRVAGILLSAYREEMGGGKPELPDGVQR